MNGYREDHSRLSSKKAAEIGGKNRANGVAAAKVPPGLYDLLKSVVARIEDMQQGPGTKVVEYLDPVEVPEKLMAPSDEKEVRNGLTNGAPATMAIGDKGLSEDELRTVVDNTFRYSVKTGHPYFCNALFHGTDTMAQVGNLLSEFLNTSGYTHEVAPVFTAAEMELVRYLGQKIGWSDPDKVDGITCPGGSISNFSAIALARHSLHPNIKSEGMVGQKPLVVYTSEEAHYSILKGATWLGIGLDNVVAVPTDDQTGAMVPEELASAIRQSIREGKEPLMVNATAGTTIRGGFDDFAALASVVRSPEFGRRIWLHGDLAWGGGALFASPEIRSKVLNGIHLADSIAYNPHKMIGAPLQCSLILTRHENLLKETNCAQATYLFMEDKFYDTSYDSGDKTVQCGRKVDSFKAWFMLKARGELYVRDRVDNAFRMAEVMAGRIEQEQRQLGPKLAGFRLVLPQACTNVCFVYVPPFMRGLDEDDEWQEKLSKVSKSIRTTICCLP